MNNYYSDQLKKINIVSKTISIKIVDYDGNATNYININLESLEELEEFLRVVKNGLRGVK